MKKLVLAAAMLFSLSAFSFAQTKAPSGQKTTTQQHAQKDTAQHTKKDGTPDKRYKENKTAKDTAVVHTKKDGTPDKRYKENKKN